MTGVVPKEIDKQELKNDVYIIYSIQAIPRKPFVDQLVVVPSQKEIKPLVKDNH